MYEFPLNVNMVIKYEANRACSTQGAMNKCMKNVAEGPKVKRLLGRLFINGKIILKLA
jgi:hypothetical protein